MGTKEQVLRVVDVRGEFCPVPIIETARAVKEMQIGDTILVIATDPGMVSDIPLWCKATGQELLSVDRHDGVIEARVRRLR